VREATEDNSAIRRDGGLIGILPGERPCPARERIIGDASDERGRGRFPECADALGVPELARPVVRQAAVALLLREIPTMTVDEAVRLATSPDGLAFLEDVVEEYQGRLDIVRFPYARPFKSGGGHDDRTPDPRTPDRRTQDRCCAGVLHRDRRRVAVPSSRREHW
jgi:hypothetical protein